jgi:hypothetical protein
MSLDGFTSQGFLLVTEAFIFEPEIFTPKFGTSASEHEGITSKLGISDSKHGMLFPKQKISDSELELRTSKLDP